MKLIRAARDFAVLGLFGVVVLLAGCDTSQLPTIPRPGDVGLPPAPGTVVVLPNPSVLPTEQLCAYADSLEVALDEWQAYANAYLELFGQAPLDIRKAVAGITKGNASAEKIIKARKVLCAQEPPLPRPAE